MDTRIIDPIARWNLIQFIWTYSALKVQQVHLIKEFLKNPHLNSPLLLDPTQWDSTQLHSLSHLDQKNNFTQSLIPQLQDHQIHTLLFGEPEYPSFLYALPHPPLVLTWMGSNLWLNGAHLALVGSREPSPSSVRWLNLFLPKTLNRFPALVISGGARGIDQISHGISIREGLPTLGVLPSGLLNPYPNNFKQWFPSIIHGGGAVLSHYSPFQSMNKHHFFWRNHLISALSGLVVAIDVRRKSGTMITARAAIEMGRSLAVLTDHPFHSHTLGGWDLIFDGAAPLRDDTDLTALCELYVRKLM